MRTFIALPCMDMVHTVFMRSLLGLDKIGEVAFGITASSLIYDARNTLAKQAIDERCDRILFIDSDMEFGPDVMKRLAEDMDEGRDFVTGLCFTRKAPIKPTIYKECGYTELPGGETVPVAMSWEDYPEEQIFEVKASGLACAMVSVPAIEKVFQKFGLPFSPMPGFGEDLSFCGRLAQLGIPMYCDSRVKIGHMALGAITEDVYKASRR